MTVGTVLSRVTGLLRIAAIAAALGTTLVADTYNIGNTAPNIIYELVLGGVLTSVFVPVFVELLEKEGREKAWEVASGIINLALLILTVITAIGIAAAPLIAKLYAARLQGPEAELQRQVLTTLLRLFIPQIIFYGLTAITAGLLNAHKRFGPPMYTPILNNIAVIAIFIAFHEAYGNVSLRALTTRQELIIGLGTTLGVALMAIAQIPFLRGLGRYRLTFSASHPALRKLVRLSVFVVGYVVANQIGYFVVQILANGHGYSAYMYAFTFFMLPHGLFAVSIITALLPGMSAHAVNEQWDEFRSQLSTGVRATMMLLLPAAVGYLVLAGPIISLLQRGLFDAESTELVAGVLRFFVIGLVPFAIFQLFLRAFYAMQNTKTPFLINCAAVAVNTAVNIPMFAWLGVKGLAAGHALAYTFGVVLQGRRLSTQIGGLDGKRILRSGVKIALASAGMGLAVWAAVEVAQRLVGDGGFGGQALVVAIGVMTGAVTYLLLAALLKVEELGFVRGILSRRLAG
jgi:putative peptidoglycan lipid II flippase